MIHVLKLLLLLLQGVLAFKEWKISFQSVGILIRAQGTSHRGFENTAVYSKFWRTPEDELKSGDEYRSFVAD